MKPVGCLKFSALVFLISCSLNVEVLKASKSVQLKDFSYSAPLVVSTITDDGVLHSGNEKSFKISGLCRYEDSLVEFLPEDYEVVELSVPCKEGQFHATVDFTKPPFSWYSNQNIRTITVRNFYFESVIKVFERLNEDPSVDVDLHLGTACKGKGGCNSIATPPSGFIPEELMVHCKPFSKVSISFLTAQGFEMTQQEKICTPQERINFQLPVDIHTSAVCEEKQVGNCSVASCEYSFEAKQTDKDLNESMDVETLKYEVVLGCMV